MGVDAMADVDDEAIQLVHTDGDEGAVLPKDKITSVSLKAKLRIEQNANEQKSSYQYVNNRTKQTTQESYLGPCDRLLDITTVH